MYGRVVCCIELLVTPSWTNFALRYKLDPVCFMFSHVGSEVTLILVTADTKC